MWCTWIAARTSFPLPFLPFPLPFSSFFGLTTAGACGFFFFFSTTATSFWKNEQAKGKASNECLSVPKTKNHKGRWHLEFGLHGFELFISSSITHVHVPQNSAFFVARLTPKNIDRGFDLNTGVSYSTPMPIDRVIENKSIHPMLNYTCAIFNVCAIEPLAVPQICLQVESFISKGAIFCRLCGEPTQKMQSRK